MNRAKVEGSGTAVSVVSANAMSVTGIPSLKDISVNPERIKFCGITGKSTDHRFQKRNHLQACQTTKDRRLSRWNVSDSETGVPFSKFGDTESTVIEELFVIPGGVENP